MKLDQHNACLMSIVDVDGLVLLHQGISSHSDDYAPMRFTVFKGSSSSKWLKLEDRIFLAMISIFYSCATSRS